MNGAGVTTRTVYAPVTDRLQQILVGRNGGVEVQDRTYTFNAIGRLKPFGEGLATMNGSRAHHNPSARFEFGPGLAIF